MSLVSRGFSAFFLQEFEKLNEPALVPARVLRGEPAPVRVQAEGAQMLASLAGKLRTRAGTSKGDPAVVVAGDWVALDERNAVVRHVLPRRTSFLRAAVGQPARPQIVAANVDIAFLVMGADHNFSLRRLERYLSLARASTAKAVVLLTKSGSVPDIEERLRAAQAVAGAAPVHAIDVIAGIAAETPARYLAEGLTAVLLGSSGAGKSTLLNHWLGGDRARTAATRVGDDKGRHTTTSRELFELPDGGAVIDTPGMREVGLWCDDDAIGATFDEVEAVAAACRFRDCRHMNEPDCAVRLAIADGRLEADRVASFTNLQQEVGGSLARQKAERRAAGKRMGKMSREATRSKYGRDE